MLFGQVANFKTNSNLPISKFAIALNSRLKKTIVIKQAEEVEEDFHARFSCKRKTYEYQIDDSPYGSAIFRNLRYHIPQKLLKENMTLKHLKQVEQVVKAVYEQYTKQK